MKHNLTLASVAILGTIFLATGASAAVVCNDDGDCWRTKENTRSERCGGGVFCFRARSSNSDSWDHHLCSQAADIAAVPPRLQLMVPNLGRGTPSRRRDSR
jgi:hypothetical protein